MPNRPLIFALARAFLAGEPSVEQVITRAGRTLGRPWRWLQPLAQQYVSAYAGRTRPRRRDVVRLLLQDPDLSRDASRPRKLPVHQWLTKPQRMQPAAAAAAWEIPAIESAGDLA